MEKIHFNGTNNGKKNMRTNVITRIANHPECGIFNAKEPEILQAVSAIFGLDEGDDAKRNDLVKEKIFPLLELPQNADKLHKLFNILPLYKARTASGAHRFMPLGLVVHNMILKRSIFSQEIIDRLPLYIADYLKKGYPLFANLPKIADKYIPKYIPDLTIRISDKRTYNWLDIGSAPKENGAPTLNTLRTILPGNLMFSGIDIAMPYFEIKEGNIVYSKYVNAEGKFMTGSIVNGIRYYNGVNTPFSVLVDPFMPEKKFDFISICKTMHHLTQDQKFEYLPMTTHPIINERGNDITRDIVVKTTKSQQKVIDRLLDRLYDKGVLFIEVPSYINHDMHLDDILFEDNFDLLFMIQRKGAKFVLYEDAPIFYEPNRIPYGPTTCEIESNLIGGSLDHSPSGGRRPDFMVHNGLISIYDMTPDQKEAIRGLFARADQLMLRYQSWKRSIWGNVHLAIQKIKEKESLEKIFSVLLSNVPDVTGDHDSQLKKRILTAVKHIEDKLKKRPY